MITILVQSVLVLAVLTIPLLALWQDRQYTREDPMRWEDDDE